MPDYKLDHRTRSQDISPGVCFELMILYKFAILTTIQCVMMLSLHTLDKQWRAVSSRTWNIIEITVENRWNILRQWIDHHSRHLSRIFFQAKMSHARLADEAKAREAWPKWLGQWVAYKTWYPYVRGQDIFESIVAVIYGILMNSCYVFKFPQIPAITL